MDSQSRLILGALLLVTALVYSPLRTAGYTYEDAHWFASLEHDRAWSVPSRDFTRQTLRWTGGRPDVDHAVNVGVHLLTGLAVAGLGTALGAPLVGLVAAGALLWHPLASEAVSYVSARGDLLVTLFTVLAVWAAVTWTTRGGWWRVVGSGGLVLAAGVSKETGLLAAPLVLWTVLACRRAAPPTAFLVNLAIGLGGILLGATWWRISSWLAMAPGVGGSVFTWPEFASLQVATVARLLTLTIWPVGFSVDHDALTLGLPWFVLGVGLVLGGAVTAWWAWHRAPVVAWVIGWVAISLAPRFVFQTNEFLREYQLSLTLPALAIGAAVLVTRGVTHAAVSPTPA